MNEYRVGKLDCYACGAASSFITEDEWFLKFKQRCQKCGSALTTWTPHTKVLGGPPMADQAMKEVDDRLKWYLLPRSLEKVVEVYTEGSKKYAERNWEKGRSFAEGFGALMRHAWAWFWRQSDGHPQGLHLASVAWWALALMEWEERHPEYDDRPYGVSNGKGTS